MIRHTKLAPSWPLLGTDSEADHRGRAISLRRALELLARGRAEWVGNPLPSTAEEFVTVGADGAQTTFGFSFIGAGAVAVLFADANGQVLIEQGQGPTQYQVAFNTLVPGQSLAMAGAVTYVPHGVPIPAGSTLTVIRSKSEDR
jgi:hypothetical protein